MRHFIFLALLFSLASVAFSIDCSSTLSLHDYLANRGGSFNSAKCVSVVILDVTSPAVLSSPTCDVLVVDSTDTRNHGVLVAAGVNCPALTTSIPTVFALGRSSGLHGQMSSIYCVESTFPAPTLYKDVLGRAERDRISSIILPVIPSDSGNFDSRVSTAAFEIRSWLMNAFGSNGMRCPFNIIIPASGNQAYHSVLNGFSKAFSKNQAAYTQSFQAGIHAPELVTDQAHLHRPTPHRRPPPPPPPPRPTPSTQLLRDFNQYEGIACPTMKNFFTLLSEREDPYVNRLTSVTTQISLAYSDFSMGIHSCEMIIMDSGANNFLEVMREMRLPYNRALQGSGITTRSISYTQNAAEWYSSLKKVAYMNLQEAVEEARTLESLSALIREAYMNLFDLASKSRLSELLILPFGLWNSRYSNSVQLLTAVVEGLALALNDYLLNNNQLHITILTETKQQFEVLIDQIKPYFMTVKASDELLRTDSSRFSRPPPPPRPPLPRTIISQIPQIRAPVPPMVPHMQLSHLFDIDGECMSRTPVSHFLETFFNGRVGHHSTSTNFSLAYTSSPPGVTGCGCLVVDASDSSQLDMASKLGISRKECMSVGSSEIKVLVARTPNPYIAEPWMTQITRVYCLDSSKFIYRSRISAISALYKKILASAKFRCNTILSPLLAVSRTTSESRNKEYIVQAVKSMDEFYSTDRKRDSIHLTFYEPEEMLFFLELEIIATYYLEYTSSGGLNASVRTINQNWISLNDAIGYQAYPEFREPSTRQRRHGVTFGSSRKEASRRVSRTSTTIPRSSRVPPPRPPLPKFTGNKAASRPAPSNAAIVSQCIHYAGIHDFAAIHAVSRLDRLYSLHYWIQQVSSFTSFVYEDLSKKIFFTNTDASRLENCQILAIDALDPGVHGILNTIGQQYPSLTGRVTVIPNRRLGGTQPLSRSLNRLYLVNTHDSLSVSAVYEEMIDKAIANTEKEIAVPLFNVRQVYRTSVREARSLILQIIQAVLANMQGHGGNSLKVIFYEDDPGAASLIFDTLVCILSGRSRMM